MSLLAGCWLSPLVSTITLPPRRLFGDGRIRRKEGGSRRSLAPGSAGTHGSLPDSRGSPPAGRGLSAKAKRLESSPGAPVPSRCRCGRAPGGHRGRRLTRGNLHMSLVARVSTSAKLARISAAGTCALESGRSYALRNSVSSLPWGGRWWRFTSDRRSRFFREETNWWSPTVPLAQGASSRRIPTL